MRLVPLDGRVVQASMAALGRTCVIAACLAVVACSAGGGSTGSTLTASPIALPSSSSPDSPSDAAEPAETATLPVMAESPVASTSPVPAKPTGVTFTTDAVELPGPAGTDEMTYQATHTVRWTAPRAEGVEIRVYGVTECLSEPSDPPPGTSGPCLVEHMLLPPSVMALAATAPAAAGVISWIAPRYWECAGPPVGPDGLDYQAVVVAAYDAAGHSIFTIAYPGGWWRAGPDEVIC